MIVAVQSRQYRIDSQSLNYLSVLKKYRYQSIFRFIKESRKIYEVFLLFLL